MSQPTPYENPSSVQPKYTQIFINNEWHNSYHGRTFPTINPSIGETICEVQEGGKEEVDKAVAAAREAFKAGSPWRRMDASKRGQLMYKLADLIQRDLSFLAEATDKMVEQMLPRLMSSRGATARVRLVFAQMMNNIIRTARAA